MIPYFRWLASACAESAVLPAPNVVAHWRLDDPSLTCRAFCTSPSGRPAAMMLAVIAITRSQPLHLSSMRTVPGCRWRPSAKSASTSSRSPTPRAHDGGLIPSGTGGDRVERCDACARRAECFRLIFVSGPRRNDPIAIRDVLTDFSNHVNDAGHLAGRYGDVTNHTREQLWIAAQEFPVAFAGACSGIAPLYSFARNGPSRCAPKSCAPMPWSRRRCHRNRRFPSVVSGSGCFSTLAVNAVRPASQRRA